MKEEWYNLLYPKGRTLYIYRPTFNLFHRGRGGEETSRKFAGGVVYSMHII